MAKTLESVSVIPQTERTVSADFECCTLCPHTCKANRASGQRGTCGANDKLVVARAALHHWEEPPISGGAGSGTIFLAHCTLSCVYCQNFQISERVCSVGREVSPEELALQCLSLQEQGALNINFVTPTHYAPLLRECISLARQAGLCIPVVWNTSGYETFQAIAANEGFVDVYLTDFKYASDALARDYSGAKDYVERAISALDAMVAQVGNPRYDEYMGDERIVGGVVVRHMMLPGHLRDSKAVLSLLHERYGNSIKLSLMNQYTPVLVDRRARGDLRAARILEEFPNLGQSVDANSYELLLDFADDLGVEDYFWQEGDAALESFIPVFS